MLVYMDGFDLHALNMTGLDVGGGGMQDAGYYWKGGTITKYSFPPGYGKGQSMRVTYSGANNARGLPIDGHEARVGFWANMAFGTTMAVFFNVVVSVNWYWDDTTGMFGLNTPAGSMQFPSQYVPNTWSYFEFYCNMDTGVYTLHMDGWPVAEVDDGWITDDPRGITLGLGSPRLDSSPNFRVDHYWATTGEYPAGTEIMAVQVAAAIDNYDSGPGFRGSLVMNNRRYMSGRKIALVSSQEDYAGGENIANVMNFLFDVNPATGTPWNAGALAAVEQWGVCYGLDVPGNTSRLAGLNLSVLRHNNGRPVIDLYNVNEATSFSGPWQKSHPGMAYSWHVRGTPRDEKRFVEDSKYLLLAGPGCVLYAGPSYAPPDEEAETRIYDVGLTFAEEFREDYQDFVRVNGGDSYDSWFISGYSVLGEGNRKFQDNYITINYENIPFGAAHVQGLWDYSENHDTGRWSMRQSIDNKGGDYKHGTRRLKIRGHGKALQIKVTNKGDNPFIINGWTSLVSSNTSV